MATEEMGDEDSPSKDGVRYYQCHWILTQILGRVLAFVSQLLIVD